MRSRVEYHDRQGRARSRSTMRGPCITRLRPSRHVPRPLLLNCLQLGRCETLYCPIPDPSARMHLSKLVRGEAGANGRITTRAPARFRRTGRAAIPRSMPLNPVRTRRQQCRAHDRPAFVATGYHRRTESDDRSAMTDRITRRRRSFHFHARAEAGHVSQGAGFVAPISSASSSRTGSRRRTRRRSTGQCASRIVRRAPGRRWSRADGADQLPAGSLWNRGCSG